MSQSAVQKPSLNPQTASNVRWLSTVTRKNSLERQEPMKKPREEPGSEGWPVLFWLCRVEIITEHGQDVQTFVDDQQGQIIIITLVVEGATGRHLRWYRKTSPFCHLFLNNFSNTLLFFLSLLHYFLSYGEELTADRSANQMLRLTADRSANRMPRLTADRSANGMLRSSLPIYLTIITGTHLLNRSWIKNTGE